MEKPGMQKEKEQDKNTSKLTDEERMKDPVKRMLLELGFKPEEPPEGWCQVRFPGLSVRVEGEKK